MNPKHLRMRIDQCLALAALSPCPRRKYGAIAFDPETNVIISEGYNGGPRGGTAMCGGEDWCRRDGIPTHDITSVPMAETGPRTGNGWAVKPIGRAFLHPIRLFDGTLIAGQPRPGIAYAEHHELLGPFSRYDEAVACELKTREDPIPSGQRYETGCHHSEANVVCNAAAAGRSLKGAWLVCTGTPCLGCAKLIHHARIAKVISIKGSYQGADEGRDYLAKHGVFVEEVDPPTANTAVGPMVDPGGR